MTLLLQTGWKIKSDIKKMAEGGKFKKQREITNLDGSGKKKAQSQWE